MKGKGDRGKENEEWERRRFEQRKRDRWKEGERENEREGEKGR